MTGTDLRDLFLSPDFKQGLTEMSSYLASIMQERPIVYLLAKCLWMRGLKFQLEYKSRDKSCDLFVSEKHMEFKFAYTCCEPVLRKELEKHGDDLKAMWSGRRDDWGTLPKIYKDVSYIPPLGRQGFRQL